MSDISLSGIFHEICSEMHVNEIHLLHNRHHKVSSLMKFHQNTQNYIKYCLEPRRLSAEKSVGAQGRKGTRRLVYFSFPWSLALRARHAKRLRRRLMSNMKYMNISKSPVGHEVL